MPGLQLLPFLGQCLAPCDFSKNEFSKKRGKLVGGVALAECDII